MHKYYSTSWLELRCKTNKNKKPRGLKFGNELTIEHAGVTAISIYLKHAKLFSPGTVIPAGTAAAKGSENSWLLELVFCSGIAAQSGGKKKTVLSQATKIPVSLQNIPVK